MPDDHARWECAAKALEGLSEAAFIFLEKNVSPPLVALKSAGLHSTSLYDFYDGFEHRVLATFCVFLVMMIYGVPHFLAWNAEFPTEIERTLWRASTAALTGLGLPAVIGAALFWCYDSRPWNHDFIVYLPFILYPIPYLFASGFLLSESIRQLVVLPDGAFQLPSYSKYWPNFS